MEELKIDYKFTLEDFNDMEKIEHEYFDNDNISPAKECLKWYDKNNMTCVGIRNSDNKIVASVSVLPLKHEIYKDILNNKMNEADVTHTQIEEYHDNCSYYIYLSSISIDVNYRNSYKVITTLIKGCIALFDALVKRGISIKEVMADASTVYGEKICKKLLKMKFIRKTNHNSQIYVLEGNEFMDIIEHFGEQIKVK